LLNDKNTSLHEAYRGRACHIKIDRIGCGALMERKLYSHWTSTCPSHNDVMLPLYGQQSALLV